MAIDNVIDPTNCNPYSTASGDNKRACPKANMVDIKAEIRRSLLISFVFSNPDDNYKVLLSEGAKEIWEIDYVKDGELKRAAGKVRNFEYWTNKHIGLSTYSANGVIQRDEKIVVKFDASIDFKNQLLSIDVRNIRGLKPAGVIEDSELNQDSSANFIKVSKNAYNFLKVAYPKEYATLTKLDNNLNTDDTEYTDYMFDGALALNELAPLNLAKVKSANYMFRDNQNLTQVQLTTSENLASAKGMFEGCSKLEQVEIKTPGLQNAEAMFKGCQALKALKLNVGSLTTTKDMFKDATALSTLRLSGKLNTGLDLTNCPLDEDSVTSVLAAMSDNGPDEDKQVRFRGATVAGNLKAIADGAARAGWLISGLTYTATAEDKHDDKLGKDIVNAYENGKKEEPKHDEAQPNKPEETHTEQPANPTTGEEGTHTETPANPQPSTGTTEGENTSVTPANPTTGEGTHTETPAPSTGTTEETHTEQPANPTNGEGTHTETPANPQPSTGETHTEAPSTGNTQPATPTPGNTETTHEGEELDPNFMVDEYNGATGENKPKPADQTGNTPAAPTTGTEGTPAAPVASEETHTESPAPAVGTTEETHTEQPSTGETHTESPVATTGSETAPVVNTETHTESPAAPVASEETHTESPAVTTGSETTTPVAQPATGETHTETSAAPTTGTEGTPAVTPSTEASSATTTPVAQPAAPATSETATPSPAAPPKASEEEEEELDPNLMLDAYNEGAN